LEKWQRLTVVFALALLLVSGLNLAARATQQIKGEEKKFFALDLKNREIVICGDSYQVETLLDRGKRDLAHLLEAVSWPDLK